MNPIRTVFLFLALATSVATAQTIDTLMMGDDASEKNHSLTAAFPPVTESKSNAAPPASDPSGGPPSDVVKGGKGEPARRLCRALPMVTCMAGN